MILKDLENEGVITQYCKIWRDSGVPSAWVLHSGIFHLIDSSTRFKIEILLYQRRITPRWL